MNDEATKPLEENLRLINPHSDPVGWNLSKALLAMANQQKAMESRQRQIEHDIARLLKAR